MNSTEHCSCLDVQLVLQWRSSYKHNVVLDSGPLASWYEKMESSAKPEVLNLSQRRQRRTEPPQQATFTKISVKFGRVVVELRERADKRTKKQTDRQTCSSQYLAPPPPAAKQQVRNYCTSCHCYGISSVITSLCTPAIAESIISFVCDLCVLFVCLCVCI